MSADWILLQTYLNAVSRIVTYEFAPKLHKEEAILLALKTKFTDQSLRETESIGFYAPQSAWIVTSKNNNLLTDLCQAGQVKSEISKYKADKWKNFLGSLGPYSVSSRLFQIKINQAKGSKKADAYPTKTQKSIFDISKAFDKV